MTDSTMSNETLQQRIAAGLKAKNITPDDLAKLVTEVEAAINSAEQAVAATRRRTLDPRIVDGGAPQSLADAEHARDRLRVALPALRRRLAEVEAAEYNAQWRADYEAVKAKRDAIATEFAELYPDLAGRLIDLFRRAEAVDEECARINSAAPAGQHQHLLGVELAARDLEDFSTVNPSVMKTTSLPDWKYSDRMTWPPPQPSLAAQFALAMVPPYDPRYSANWAAAMAEDNARRAANEARWAEEEAARQAESRRVYEASLRR